MSKPRRVKRHRQIPRQATRATERVPSAHTLYHFALIDDETRRLVDEAGEALEPEIRARDEKAVQQIKSAPTAEAVLDLARLATGLGESAWQARMRQFGPEVALLISHRLKNVRAIRDEQERDIVTEQLIAALRWKGQAGAQVLPECFDLLDEYGQSLVCLVLGLLQVKSAADMLWSFYQKAKDNRRENNFVGALLGLIDLEDERVPGALADLLRQGRDYYEMYGFLSRAGDARAVALLVRKSIRLPENEKYQALLALTSIGHRIGREALLAEFAKMPAADSTPQAREAIADKLFSQPASVAEEYFGLFYRRPGLIPDA